MFGVNSAPKIFQSYLSLLAPCNKCLNYTDDVNVFGNTKKVHDEAVNKVMKVFKKNNLLT